MGLDKTLLPWKDTVVIGALLEALTAGGVTRITVVVSPQGAALQSWAEAAGWQTVVNPDPARGMLSSVWEGVEALGGATQLAADGTDLFVCPADLPGVDRETVVGLRRLIARGAALAVPSYRGRRGHPLAISSGLVSQIPGLSLEVGLREVIERHIGDLVELPVEHPGVVLDLDTPSDYDAAIRALEDDSSEVHEP